MTGLEQAIKLSNIQLGAEAEMTNSELKALYESNSGRNEFDDVNKASLDNIEDVDWIPVTFLNAWTQYSGWEPTSYYKDKTGTVFVRGLIQGGATSTAAFNLPVGYRPGQHLIFNTLSTTVSDTRLNVDSTGNVTPAAGTVNTFVSVACSFKAV